MSPDAPPARASVFTGLPERCLNENREVDGIAQGHTAAPRDRFLPTKGIQVLVPRAVGWQRESNAAQESERASFQRIVKFIV